MPVHSLSEHLLNEFKLVLGDYNKIRAAKFNYFFVYETDVTYLGAIKLYKVSSKLYEIILLYLKMDYIAYNFLFI
jgi:hypothetical protein